jgi:hypothetical protein
MHSLTVVDAVVVGASGIHLFGQFPLKLLPATTHSEHGSQTLNPPLGMGLAQ